MNALSGFVAGIVGLLFSAQFAIAGQPETATFNRSVSLCQRYLAQDGFENIQIKIGLENTVWIYYENHRYRNELAALGVVLGYAAGCFKNADSFILVPRLRRVAICYITINPNDARLFLQNRITPDEFIDLWRIANTEPDQPLRGYETPSIRSSLFNLDCSVLPGVKTQFARPGDPVQMQFNFLANVTSTIATGAQLYGQLITPLYNEFQTDENNFRIGSLYINQLLRLKSATYISLSAGLFEYSYAGISTMMQRYFFGNRASLSARLDYFDNSLFRDPAFAPGDVRNHRSYLVQAHYYFEQVDFRASVTWGRYALGDEGWRVDLTRTFHELELGVMGVWNESLEFLTGLHVRVPFPVIRHAAPSRVRLRGPNFMEWNYRYLPCYDGQIIESGVEHADILRQFSPGFLDANAHQLRTAQRFVRVNP
ncbi:MAG: YjbH domain-containing protein [Candidatus Zhuqueibacterota bacterium]